MMTTSVFDLAICMLLGFYCPEPPILTIATNDETNPDAVLVLRDCRHQNSQNRSSLAYDSTGDRNLVAWGAMLFSDNPVIIKDHHATAAMFWRTGKDVLWAVPTIKSSGTREWDFFRLNIANHTITHDTLFAMSEQQYQVLQEDIAQVPEEYRKSSRQESISPTALPASLTKGISQSWLWFTESYQQASCREQLQQNDYKKTYERDISLIAQ